MKAIQCKELSEPDNWNTTIEFNDIEDPEFNDDQVLIEIKVASVNFPDVLMVQGKYQFQPPMPFIPGAEASGVIVGVGSNIKDFNIGDIYEHWPGGTITETDNIWFTNLTMNTHPVHFDANYASKTEFKRYLVNSAFTLSLVTGMCVSGTSQKAIANLGWEEIKLPAPVFVGDTLYSETEVLYKRESKSRPTQGIVRFRLIGKNQDNVIVMDMVRSFLVAKRGHSVVDEIISKTK